MKKVTLKKDFIMAEMYEDFRKMRVERKIDRLLDSLSEYSALMRGGPGSGAGTGIRGAGSAIGRGGSGTGAGTGIKGAGTPSRPPRSEDMDNEPEGNESFIEDNPPDEGKESISVSSRPYDHPLKAGSSLSIEQIFPGFMNGDFTDDNGIEKIGDKVHDDEQPAEEDNDQKLQNDINNVPNQNADELYDDVKDEMLGEMIDDKLSEGKLKDAIKGGATGLAIGVAAGTAVRYGVSKYKCKDIKDPEKKKQCFKDMWKHGALHKPNTEGLSGPGGKFGFEGEEGYKGKMGEDSNASEEK